VSVAKYSREKLQQLYSEACGILGSVPFCCIDSEKLAGAIRAAYYANRAAMACTYNEEITVKPFGLENKTALQADKKDVFQKIGLLMYNCVSNAGRDFLPGEDRDILEGLQRSIAYSLIEED